MRYDAKFCPGCGQKVIEETEPTQDKTYGQIFNINGTTNTYEGELLNNVPEGIGILTELDGSRYEGEFRNGKRTGWGKYHEKRAHFLSEIHKTIPMKDKLRNLFANVDTQVTGVETLKNLETLVGFSIQGALYEGEWLNDKFHGYGTLSLLRESHYVMFYQGYFKRDHMEGDGEMFLKDVQYRGPFKNSTQHGYGKYIFNNGETWEGTIKRGYRHGLGSQVFPDGSTFEGKHVRGMRHGLGISAFPNGFTLQGTYNYGTLNGFVSGSLPNGSKYAGTWQGSTLTLKGGIRYEWKYLTQTENTVETSSYEGTEGSTYEQLLSMTHNASTSVEKGDILEAFSAVLLNRMGYMISNIPGGAGDGGVDVLAYKNDDLGSIKNIIQCKNYPASSVGSDDVMKLIGSVGYFKAQAGFIFTTGTFTKDAISTAERHQNIKLINGDELQALTEKYIPQIPINSIINEARQWKSG